MEGGTPKRDGLITPARERVTMGNGVFWSHDFRLGCAIVRFRGNEVKAPVSLVKNHILQEITICCAFLRERVWGAVPCDTWDDSVSSEWG